MTDIYQVSLRTATNNMERYCLLLSADARNVTLRKHTINGAKVEVSCHPSTSEEPELQVGHWDNISGSKEVVVEIVMGLEENILMHYRATCKLND